MTNRIEDIWSKIDIRTENECWEWLGHRNKDRRGKDRPGYGRINIGGLGKIYAHRIAYLAAFPGSITLSATDGKLVLHNCDNPGCCNPKHLFIGTQSDNMVDMVRKHREVPPAPRPRKSKPYGSTDSPRAKLSAADVRGIRIMREAGIVRRVIAESYGVSLPTIKGVLSGRHYADIGD